MFAAGFVCGVLAVFVVAGLALAVQAARDARRRRREGARLEALLNESRLEALLNELITGGAVFDAGYCRKPVSAEEFAQDPGEPTFDVPTAPRGHFRMMGH